MAYNGSTIFEPVQRVAEGQAAQGRRSENRCVIRVESLDLIRNESRRGVPSFRASEPGTNALQISELLTTQYSCGSKP